MPVDFTEFFKFHLFIYSITDQKSSNQVEYLKYQSIFQLNKHKLILFLTTFYYFLYSFYLKTTLHNSTRRRILFCYPLYQELWIGETERYVLDHSEMLKTMVIETGNFYINMWIPGILTTFIRASNLITQRSLPYSLFEPAGLVISAETSTIILRECKNSYTPSVNLSKVFSYQLLKSADFLYMFASLCYNIWCMTIPISLEVKSKTKKILKENETWEKWFHEEVDLFDLESSIEDTTDSDEDY